VSRSRPLGAKRIGPPDVAPVVVGSTRYQVLPWGKERGLGQNGGYLSAVDTTTEQEIALIKVFEIDYNPNLESDVQDVFIESIRLHPDGLDLVVKDELGRCYVVDLQSKSVRAHATKD
jgi:hypothetical protein